MARRLLSRIFRSNVRPGKDKKSAIAGAPVHRSRPLRVGLVGCVKSKRDLPTPAQDLYVSSLFLGRRRYVEKSCDTWHILSAKHGLVDRLEVIEPYDVEMSRLSRQEKASWAAKVVNELKSKYGDISGIIFEIHSGASYRNNGLIAGLRGAGANIEIPAEFLKFGEQLSFYSNPQSIKPTAVVRSGSGVHARYDRIADLLDDHDATEVDLGFDEIEAAMARPLPRSAAIYVEWWANSASATQSRGWVQRGWRTYQVRVQDRVIHFRRQEVVSGALSTRGAAIEAQPATDSATMSPVVHLEVKSRNDLVEALLAHGASLKTEPQGEYHAFTPNIEANKMIFEDPFAFLVAVIFDQGISAERAWAAPFEIRQRLGYFDVERLAAEPHEVRRAIQQPPMLHRFKDTIPEWVTSAAQRVLAQYHGDASNIWNDSPTATTLQLRLIAFKGIGQKKAAMAVEILERDLDVEVLRLEGSDVAFDVHLRRVFLRIGLANTDGLEEIVNSARLAHPERPGSLDYPAWDIGRRWCRPTNPSCPSCVMNHVCPKFIEHADGVKGISGTWRPAGDR